MKIFSMFWDNLKATGMIYLLRVSNISPTKSLGPGTVIVREGSLFSNLNFSLAVVITPFFYPFLNDII